jgi:predicted glycosyltransferase
MRLQRYCYFSMNNKAIWIDFDNSPHVPVLLPIANELRKRGYSLYLTARDVAQTVDLLRMAGKEFALIDKAFPKGRIKKLYFTIKRACALFFHLKGIKPDCALNHSSRSAILAAWLKKIPCLVMYDYEYVDSFFQNYFATRVLMPEAVNNSVAKKAGIRISNLNHYPGLKEQIYLHDFCPRNDFLGKLHIDAKRIIVTIRPLGTGHYCNKAAEPILIAVMELLAKEKERLFVIALPRDQQEKAEYDKKLSSRGLSYLIPKHALPGTDLVYHSDLVITGSGTMAREAAVLGVPAYSIFSGPKGAVDSYLESIGRLIFINSINEVEKISIEKKGQPVFLRGGDNLIPFICDKIAGVMKR